MFKKYELTIGIIFFIVSLLLMIFFIGKYSLITVLPLGWNWVSIMIILDYFDRKLLKDSYISRGKHFKRLLKIFVVSMVFGIMLDLFGAVFTKLWIFPYFPLSIYVFLVPIGYSTYTVILLALYELMKKFTGGISRYSRIPGLYTQIMYGELILGIELAVLEIWQTIILLRTQHIAFLDITKLGKADIPFWYIFVMQLMVFFLFEFICFKEKKPTLTRDLLNGNFRPILAILLATVSAVVLIEFMNAPFGVWRFSNWLYNDVKILTVPVVALIAWPFQFPMFLSMMRVALSKEEIDIW